MGLGIDWDFGNLEGLMEDRGDYVIWEKAVADPSRNADHYVSMLEVEARPGNRPELTQAHDSGGTGWRHRDPQVIRGLITNIQSGPNRQLMEFGYGTQGDCVFSPSMHVGPIGDFDLITFTVPLPVGEGQVIVRGAATMGDNAALNTNVAEDSDRLWYAPACATWCEDVNGTTYSEGSDFLLTEKRIQWVGNQPLVGVSYTLKYQGYVEWVAYSAPFARFDNGRSLAQKVLLKKRHVALLRNPTDTVEKRIEEEATFTNKTLL